MRKFIDIRKKSRFVYVVKISIEGNKMLLWFCLGCVFIFKKCVVDFLEKEDILKKFFSVFVNGLVCIKCCYRIRIFFSCI